jgi:large subunit ribosomal protein L22
MQSEDDQMEASATARHIRITPRKARQVVDLIRGKMVGDAINILNFTPLHAARIVKKLLDSAVANAEQKKVGDPDALKVAKAYVNQGVTMKRMRARAMGRGNVIKKRTSHITVVLSA